MKNFFKKFIPRSIRPKIQGSYYLLLDIVDTLLHRRNKLIPPRRMSLLGSGKGDFKKTGEEFLGYFIKFSGLNPSAKVLDVGCGIGRMAVPLTEYLDEQGSYVGFDIIAESINWCNKNISKKYPNFQFQLADILNKSYNPKGKYTAHEYQFPYVNESFDFVFLTSVFTHMFPRDMENYLANIARVLKRGGTCFITFFLLNKESSQLINLGKSTLDFRYKFKNYHTTDSGIPESAIAYDETLILSLYKKYGLKIKLPINYGSWCARPESLSYQDIIIAHKE